MPTDTKELTDEELMRGVMERDGDAYSELVRRHTDRFYSLSYRMLSEREGAEDVVQESFLMLWNSPSKWDPAKKAKFTTWFYRVVVNACLDVKKTDKPGFQAEEYDIPDDAPGQDEAADFKRTKDEVETLIRQLPESQQTALTLCFYEGVSRKEAASIMGVSVKALESLLMRAKGTLREKLTKRNNTGVV